METCSKLSPGIVGSQCMAAFSFHLFESALGSISRSAERAKVFLNFAVDIFSYLSWGSKANFWTVQRG